MNAMTPLQQALVAWSRTPDPNSQQAQWDDAVTLGETGVFSNSNISLITGLNPDRVASLTGKTDKTGGRFNPEALPFIYDLRIQWARYGVVSHKDVVFILEMKVSANMLAKLTGISRSAIYSWAKKATQ